MLSLLMALCFAISSCGGAADDPNDSATISAQVLAPATAISDEVVTFANTPAAAANTSNTVPASPAVAAPARLKSGIGINVSFFTYWATDFPVIDQFKRAGGWFTQCNSSQPQCQNFPAGGNSWDTREQAALNLDENGWVKSLPSSTDAAVKYRSVGAILFQGDGGGHPAGRYTVLYDGQGTVTYGANGKKVDGESRPGRDIVEVPSPGTLTIGIGATTPGNHIRNIRVIAPGGVCSAAPDVYVADNSTCGTGAFQSFESLEKTRTWHPAYLKDMRGFRAIRFQDWTKINSTKLATWAERPKPGDAFWSSDKGMPIEAVLDAANSAGADPWINLSPYVDDDYVRQFANLVKARLAPTAVLYAEYGNEPWNYAYPFGTAGAYYEAKAREKWPTAANEGLKLRLNWYAYRSASVCRMLKAEFGDQASRVRCVVNGQADYPAVSDLVLACPLAAAELGAACARIVDALAVAPYFGGYIAQEKFKPVIETWLAGADRGLTGVFQEIAGLNASGVAIEAPLYVVSKSTPKNGALGQARESMLASKTVAQTHGLPMIAYEGGEHLVPAAAYKEPAMLDLLARANLDPRMGAAYKRYMKDWIAAGGELFMQYSYTNTAFALKPNTFETSAPKWDAVKAYRDGACWWPGC